jgi:hypothetical protein
VQIGRDNKKERWKYEVVGRYPDLSESLQFTNRPGRVKAASNRLGINMHPQSIVIFLQVKKFMTALYETADTSGDGALVCCCLALLVRHALD